MKLTNEQHARIMNAYIKRLTISDLESIIEAQRDCARAGMQLGTTSQIAAGKNADAVAVAAIEKMLDCDVTNIETIIQDVIS